eukprot:scaffold4672_cov129-Isochrysis_galbana.AAC.6
MYYTQYTQTPTPKCVLSRIIWAICCVSAPPAACCGRRQPALRHCALRRIGARCSTRALSTAYSLPTAYLQRAGPG